MAEPPKKDKKPAKTGEAQAAPKAAKKALKVAPLAPANPPILPPLAGVSLGTGMAGVRYAARTDVLFAQFAPGTKVAGVFTASKCPSAPVDWCRSILAKGTGRGLVVNSGNANAFTGKAGAQAAKETAAAAAKIIGCPQNEVYLASTGVIGEVLPASRIVKALPAIAESAAPDHFAQAARAIMTTDTFPKVATATALIDGAEVRINGIAKGSGMIQPDLATMLSFIFTDAALPAPVLQTLLTVGVRDSFNAITVDSDTSTSDTVLFFATGKGPAHAPITRAGDPRLKDFREKLQTVLTDLAHQVVKDGEGAAKFVAITVTGAETVRAARTIGFAIANSPLVKTAIAGEDANWGRVVMAVGKSGEAADRDKLTIKFGGMPVAREGGADPRYDEAKMSAYMKGDHLSIEVDVGIGQGSSTVWTCDLTHGYIDINADYRS